MRVEEFNILDDRAKWDNWKTLKDVIWICENCGEEMEEPESSFMGSRHCGECDHELTRRTNGGQNNPFGWKVIKK